MDVSVVFMPDAPVATVPELVVDEKDKLMLNS
jgi:hypothetical protein